MASRRFAEDTKVPVARSHETIKADLRLAGATSIAIMESAAGEATVAFHVRDTLYRISSPDWVKGEKSNPEQMERRAWRCIALLVKAKRVAITEAISTVEKEFLAHAVMPDGKTLGEHSKRLISDAYASGGAPKLLLIGGPK